MMNIFHLIFAILILPSMVSAEWVLEQSEDGHWISCHTVDQHQFVVSEKANEKQFLLILTLQEQNSPVPTSAVFRIDKNKGTEYPLRLLKQRPSGLALQLVLDEAGQDKLIGQLVAGLKLYVDFGERQIIDFSLAGFTDVFSNLLIANDIGWLDPFWLQSHGKNKEIACYEISVLSVQTIQARQQGRTKAETFAMLAGTTDAAADPLPDIISWAYGIPEAALPNIPMTKKYAIFRQCMQNAD